MKLSRHVVVVLAVLAIGAASDVAFFRNTGLHERAPQVGYTLLDGQQGSIEGLRGKVVLVNFWATSCVSCVKEMPKMVETYKKFAPRGYEMIAVAMSYDHPNQVAAFAASHRLPFKVALDGDGAIAKGFGEVRATPVSFVIDREGRILRRYLGEPEWSELHALLDKALGDPV